MGIARNSASWVCHLAWSMVTQPAPDEALADAVGWTPPVPKTWNSHSDTPYCVARWVVFSFTYRPEPVTLMVCVPPVPVVVVLIVVQAVPSAEAWMVKALAYAASQLST